MQDQHSISFAAGIRRGLPSQLINAARSLTIILVGEIVKKEGNGIKVETKGRLEVHGQIMNAHMQARLLEVVREKSGGREVRDMTTIQKR